VAKTAVPFCIAKHCKKVVEKIQKKFWKFCVCSAIVAQLRTESLRIYCCTTFNFHSIFLRRFSLESSAELTSSVPAPVCRMILWKAVRRGGFLQICRTCDRSASRFQLLDHGKSF
jgi:hypothetical protein